jgi:hypothetical protein
MKVNFAIIATALVVAPLSVVSAAPVQTMDTSEQDAQYEACIAAALSWNYTPNQASNMCYANIYGNETSGGGEPNTYPRPAPGNDCYGAVRPCIPY